MVGAVVGCWAEGRVVWGGEVQASWVEEFGLILGSGVLGILGKVEVGSVEENGSVLGGA